MKLQISQNLQAGIASKLGTKSDKIGRDVTRILQEFAVRSFDPITRRDVTAVLNSLGWSTDNPTAWAEIGNAIESRTSKSGERGFYTQRGLRAFGPLASAKTETLENTPVEPTFAIPEMTPVSPENAWPEPFKAPDVNVLHRAGVSWSPELAHMAPEGYYAEDTGLRRLAASDSSCYGVGFTAKDGICALCPLSRFCREASLGVLVDIAAKLDEKTERELADAAKPLKFEAAKTRAESFDEALKNRWGVDYGKKDSGFNPDLPDVNLTTQEVDEVLPNTHEEALVAGLLDGAPQPTEDTTEDALLERRYGVGGFRWMPLPFEGVCGHCDAVMPKGFKTVHIPGAGVLHPACALARP